MVRPMAGSIRPGSRHEDHVLKAARAMVRKFYKNNWRIYKRGIARPRLKLAELRRMSDKQLNKFISEHLRNWWKLSPEFRKWFLSHLNGDRYDKFRMYIMSSINNNKFNMGHGHSIWTTVFPLRPGSLGGPAKRPAPKVVAHRLRAKFPRTLGRPRFARQPFARRRRGLVTPGKRPLITSVGTGTLHTPRRPRRRPTFFKTQPKYVKVDTTYLYGNEKRIAKKALVYAAKRSKMLTGNITPAQVIKHLHARSDQGEWKQLPSTFKIYYLKQLRTLAASEGWGKCPHLNKLLHTRGAYTLSNNLRQIYNTAVHPTGYLPRPIKPRLPGTRPRRRRPGGLVITTGGSNPKSVSVPQVKALAVALVAAMKRYIRRLPRNIQRQIRKERNTIRKAQIIVAYFNKRGYRWYSLPRNIRGMKSKFVYHVNRSSVLKPKRPRDVKRSKRSWQAKELFKSALSWIGSLRTKPRKRGPRPPRPAPRSVARRRPAHRPVARRRPRPAPRPAARRRAAPRRVARRRVAAKMPKLSARQGRLILQHVILPSVKAKEPKLGRTVAEIQRNLILQKKTALYHLSSKLRNEIFNKFYHLIYKGRYRGAFANIGRIPDSKLSWYKKMGAMYKQAVFTSKAKAAAKAYQKRRAAARRAAAKPRTPVQLKLGKGQINYLLKYVVFPVAKRGGSGVASSSTIARRLWLMSGYTSWKALKRRNPGLATRFSKRLKRVLKWRRFRRTFWKIRSLMTSRKRKYGNPGVEDVIAKVYKLAVANKVALADAKAFATRQAGIRQGWYRLTPDQENLVRGALFEAASKTWPRKFSNRSKHTHRVVLFLKGKSWNLIALKRFRANFVRALRGQILSNRQSFDNIYPLALKRITVDAQIAAVFYRGLLRSPRVITAARKAVAAGSRPTAARPRPRPRPRVRPRPPARPVVKDPHKLPAGYRIKTIGLNRVQVDELMNGAIVYAAKKILPGVTDKASALRALKKYRHWNDIPETVRSIYLSRLNVIMYKGRHGVFKNVIQILRGRRVRKVHVAGAILYYSALKGPVAKPAPRARPRVRPRPAPVKVQPVNLTQNQRDAAGIELVKAWGTIRFLYPPLQRYRFPLTKQGARGLIKFITTRGQKMPGWKNVERDLIIALTNGLNRSHAVPTAIRPKNKFPGNKDKQEEYTKRVYVALLGRTTSRAPTKPAGSVTITIGNRQITLLKHHLQAIKVAALMTVGKLCGEKKLKNCDQSTLSVKIEILKRNKYNQFRDVFHTDFVANLKRVAAMKENSQPKFAGFSRVLSQIGNIDTTAAGHLYRAAGFGTGGGGGDSRGTRTRRRTTPPTPRPRRPFSGYGKFIFMAEGGAGVSGFWLVPDRRMSGYTLPTGQPWSVYGAVSMFGRVKPNLYVGGEVSAWYTKLKSRKIIDTEGHVETNSDGDVYGVEGGPKILYIIPGTDNRLMVEAALKFGALHARGFSAGELYGDEFSLVSPTVTGDVGMKYAFGRYVFVGLKLSGRATLRKLFGMKVKSKVWDNVAGHIPGYGVNLKLNLGFMF